MIRTAREFVADLGATTRSPKAWWQRLEPRLTPQAAADMRGMDPSWVEPMTLTSGGWVVIESDEQSEEGHEHGALLSVDVVVPTNQGKVTVTLRPAPQGSTYLVVRYQLGRRS